MSGEFTRQLDNLSTFTLTISYSSGKLVAEVYKWNKLSGLYSQCPERATF
jgi:hypothetical protein